MLKKAEKVYKARTKTYGDAVGNLDRIGQMWGIILDTEPIPANKVAACFVAVKTIREVRGKHKEDNLIDIACYAEIWNEAAPKV